MVGSGVVKAVTGVVKAIAVDGAERILQVGDKVSPNEQIITGDGGAIAVEFSDGTMMDLGRNSDVTLNEATLISYEANKLASPTLVEDAQGEVAAIQEVLAEDGTFDPSKLDAPAAGGVAAAGGAAGMENNGSTVVEIDYLNPTMTPYNGFDTTGINVVFPEPIEELLLEPNEESNEDPLPPSIALSLEAEVEYIKEDSEDNVINLNVNVDNPGTDVLQTITISQLPAVVSPDDLDGLKSAAGVSSWTGDGVNTPLVLTLDTGVTSFSGSFKVSPLEDSDVDITGILVTATAINAAVPTLQETASDTFDVVVDAILDEQVQIVQTEEAFHSTSRGSVTMPLNLDLSMVDALFPGSLDGGPDDTDDSEKVSSVIITIDEPGADLTVDSPYGLTYNSSEGNYTLTGYSNAAELEIAIESLAVETPAGRYYGVINGTITTKTEDANLNGGLELDSEDNSREGVFHFYARVADNPLDGWLDITETATDPQFAKIGFYIDNSSLKLDIANAEDQSFGIDLSQLSSNPTIQNSIFDKVDISGNIGAQENNQLSLSAQDVLDFNRPLNIVGNTGDQVNLIDDDGPNEPGSWFNNTTLPDTYSYQDSTGNIIANITIDDSLTVVI